MYPQLLVIPCFLIMVDGTKSKGGAGRSPSQSPDINRPTFRYTPRSVTVSPGDRAVLKCRVDHLGTKTVTWKKSGQVHPLTIGHFPFAPDTRISIDYNQRSNEWSLVIQDVRPMDDGTYQCQISTKNDHDTYDIRLNVKNIQVSGDGFVEEGGRIRLVCNATGRPDPPLNVEWFKDGQRVRSDARNRVVVTKKIDTKLLVSVLLIHDSQATDAGNYTCRSSNEDTGTVVVRVLNAPAIDGSLGLLPPSRSSFSPATANSNCYTTTFFLLNSFDLLSRLMR